VIVSARAQGSGTKIRKEDYHDGFDSDGGTDGEDKWDQCDSCKKWRKLPPHTDLSLLGKRKWFCEMNPDKRHAKCGGRPNPHR
jgi:hypothetical protein